MQWTIRTKLGLIITILAVGVAARAQETGSPPASAPASQPAATATTQPALDPQVDKILTRLEERVVRDLRAEVTWRLQYVLDLDEDAVVKKGRLWYQQGEPTARFLVHFTKKISSNRLHELDERHMFDGRWYIEVNSETKTYTKREIRREGDTANPYRLGEGPFPLPFGQKKEDILREFAVTVLPPAEGDPPATDHLRLDPREGSETGRSYRQVDVWVAREGPSAGLPMKLHSAKLDGTGKVNSYLTITFDDVQLNTGFSASVFELRPPAGYDVHEERLDPIALPEGAGEP
ncbi:MAG: hypothetical protein PVJ57_15725 [Phycisphaerae bacterium]|jgi:hypothetical protein